jgi:hypothetical protein
VAQLPSNSSSPRPAVVGRAEPRLFTPPLRELTEETSLGFLVIEFAHDVLGMTLMPWQQWLLIHALELKEDGSPRFRNVLVLVARQSGKTTLLTVLALFWLFVEQVPLILGTSTNLDTTRESWQAAVERAETNELLQGAIAPNGVRRANGEQELKTVYGSRYKIAAANRKGGRGLTVHRLIADELREHHNWDSWSAASNAMNAVPDAQAWCLSNAGDDSSVVLNHFRAASLAGENPAWAIFEWSAPEGCELDDPDGRAQANPALGHTITMDVLDAAMVMTPAAYRTEILCQHVPALDAAVDMAAWAQTADVLGDLSGSRSRIALCVDVSPDLRHATLVAAAVQSSGKVRVETVGSWDSPAQLRLALPGLLKRVKPRVIGWFPSGPAAALAVELKDLKKGVEIKTTDVGFACQSFAEQVASGRVLHPNDPLLNAHLGAASRLAVGDGWRFARGDGGQVDAAYAVAGAVYLARTLPRSAGPPRVIAAD